MDRLKRSHDKLLKIFLLLLGLLCIQLDGATGTQNDLKPLLRRKSHPQQPMLKDDDTNYYYNGGGRPAGE